MPRFIPKLHISLSGDVSWRVWDTREHSWSPYSCHGKYADKARCQEAIAWSMDACRKTLKN